MGEFTYPSVNVIVSNQGFRIQAHGRYGLRYWEKDEEVTIGSETLANGQLWVASTGMRLADGSPLSAEESKRVIENIRRACAWKGWSLQIDRGMSEDEVFADYVVDNPKARLSPDTTLRFAQRYLDPVLNPLGYILDAIEQGKDSNGWFARGHYKKPGRAIELNAREDLASVRYIVGDDAVDHRDWLGYLGVEGSFPDTSNDPRQPLAALADDMNGPCAALIRGEQDEEFHRCARLRRSNEGAPSDSDAPRPKRWWRRGGDG